MSSILTDPGAWGAREYRAYFACKRELLETLGLDPEAASERALLMTVAEWLNRNPPASVDLYHCTFCGMPTGHRDLAIVGAGAHWVHRDCHQYLRASRYAEAMLALIAYRVR